MFDSRTFIHRRLKYGVVVLFALLAIACTAALSNTGSSAPNSAAELYHHRCGSCHAPFPAHSYNDGEWRGAVRKMAPLANLTPDETSRILSWLQENN